MIKLKTYKSIILAAGVSSRLRPLTDDKPKCLLEIGGESLLYRTIDNIIATGIDEIAIVIGYKGEMIREFVKKHFPQLRIRFILNPNYASTNNAYSLLLGKRFLEKESGEINSGLLLLDSDILFSSKLLPFLLSHKANDKLAVRVSGDHNEEEIRIKIDSTDNIVRIGKELTLDETYGESIGVEVFSKEASANLFTILEERIRNGSGRTEFYEASFQEMIKRGAKLKAIDISEFSTIEIDTIEDLRLAEKINID